MSEQHDMHGGQGVGDKPISLKRRGLIAGAAALAVAALASKANVEDVAAANGDPLLIGNNATPPGYQTATSGTWLATTSVTTAPAFRATNAFGGTPDAHGDGIQGYTVGTSNAGIFGRNNELNGVGAWGEAPNGTGTFGDSNSGSGVAGSSVTGAGIYAQSTSGAGVFGVSNSNNGVYGQSATGYGVYGLSNGGYGVVGVTTAAGFGGCTGITSTPGASAFVGGAPAGSYAAYFSGATVVQGDFAVVGGTKNAAVKDKNGVHRLVHCVEAPEAWFEDFGTGQVVNGKGQVKLDPDFMSLVHASDYHVFLTEYDTNNGLSVSNRTAASFDVKANNANGNGSFSWRLVAKRGDVKSERLAKFNLPSIKVPTTRDLATPQKPTPPKGR
jgi:hypothetical protein